MTAPMTPDELEQLAGKAAAENDPDPYWDYDDAECWNCGGEGFVYGCSWDWQCDTWDEGEGTCLCARRCDVCQPRQHLIERTGR